jgi:dynein heavy chain
MQRKIKFAISEGLAVLYADANETFDPVIEPVLGKATIKAGTMTMIKIGEESVEYNDKFRFYVTTKISKPHYAPEVCVMVNILNFMVTEEGLKDQMLTQVVEHEDPKTTERSRNAIK